MDVQEIVGQFIKSAAEDPSQLEQFGVNPGEAIKNATGVELTDEELKDVVTAVEPLIEGKEMDMNKVMEVVGDFMGDGNILGKLGSLFGGK